MNHVHELYRAMLAADQRFHDALVTAYGRNQAGDMRYRREHPDHPEVTVTGSLFVAACERWREEYTR